MIRVSVEAAREAAIHRPDGYIDDVMSSGTLDGEYVLMTTAAYDRLVLKYAGCLRPCGVGCQLKKMLELIGIRETPGCLCGARAAIMDSWGPDTCEAPEKTAEILGWLKEEADRRSVPYLDAAARLLLRRAIRLARANAAAVAQYEESRRG